MYFVPLAQLEAASLLACSSVTWQSPPSMGTQTERTGLGLGSQHGTQRPVAAGLQQPLGPPDSRHTPVIDKKARKDG